MIQRMAKSVYKHLQESKSKDISLLVKSNKYKVVEYEEEIDEEFNGWDTLIIDFNYSNKELPNLEQIENFIYNTFKKVLS